MEIAVIGKEDFCLGFRLAGIKKIFDTEKPMEAIAQTREDASVGVVVVDERLLSQLEGDEKQSLDDSLKPIYISLSTEASEEAMRRMIRKSIGVEL